MDLINESEVEGKTEEVFSNPSSGNQTGEFQRIEDKFLLSLDVKDDVKKILNHYMEPSYLFEDTKYTLIESIYFDSPSLDFYRDHFMGLPKRYKLRARNYAPDGDWMEGPYLLELKRKQDGKSKKTRFKIFSSQLKHLMNEDVLKFTEKFRELNSTIKRGTLTKRMDKVNDLFLGHNLIPAVSLRYQRHAFEKNGLRITLDTDLSASFYYNVDDLKIKREKIQQEVFWEKAKNLSNKFSLGKNCILEVKHQGEYPKWVDDFLKKYTLGKDSFSKYCWFTTNHLLYGK